MSQPSHPPHRGRPSLAPSGRSASIARSVGAGGLCFWEDRAGRKWDWVVAVFVCLKIDYLVSWNYKHLANVNREKRILSANYQHNYFHPLRIITPTELIY
jgi:hypothetical protein